MQLAGVVEKQGGCPAGRWVHGEERWFMWGRGAGRCGIEKREIEVGVIF